MNYKKLKEYPFCFEPKVLFPWQLQAIEIEGNLILYANGSQNMGWVAAAVVALNRLIEMDTNEGDVNRRYRFMVPPKEFILYEPIRPYPFIEPEFEVVRFPMVRRVLAHTIGFGEFSTS